MEGESMSGSAGELRADRADYERRVFQELSPRLPAGCILTGDSGSAADRWAHHLELRAGMKAILSPDPATSGAVAYAIAAKLAFPDRPVIAVVGEGAMRVEGLSDLITIQRHRERWSDQTLIVLVLGDQGLTPATLSAFPYAEYAEMIGLTGVRLFDPDHLGEAWDELLAAGQPAVMEVPTDPEAPLLPPHARLEQAKGLAEAVLNGNPVAPQGPQHSLRDKVAELVQS
jgi:pyruvate dehydrogenase (quinone)